MTDMLILIFEKHRYQSIYMMTHPHCAGLQPYHHSLHLKATVLTHAANNILPHETPTIAPTN